MYVCYFNYYMYICTQIIKTKIMRVIKVLNTIEYLCAKLYLKEDELPINSVELFKIRRKIKMLKYYLIHI